MTEKIEMNPKAPKFKVNVRVRITKDKNIFLLSLKLMIESQLLRIRIFLVKVTLKPGLEKYLLLILF